MTVQRLVGLSVVLSLAAGCAANRNLLAPQSGPKARITASYMGGLTNRSAQARFTVQSDAYVMVGHLGGDGYIRILYPTSPNDRGAVRKGKTYSTAHTFATHDALPSLYSARPVRYRHVSARMDSYDGNGNGYFFIIASDYPLFYDEVSDGAFFDEIEVPNYFDTHDPRLTIKALGDLVSGGRRYTLDFASSFGSVNLASALDHQMDCALLSTMDLSYLGLALWTQPYSYAYGSRGFGSAFGRNGCSSRYASGYGYHRYQNYYYATPTVVVTPPRADTDRGTIRPPWQRRVTPRPRSATAASRSYLPERLTAHRATAARRYPANWSHTPGGLTRVEHGSSGSSGSAREASPARQAAPERHAERAERVHSTERTTQPASAPRAEKKDP